MRRTGLSKDVQFRYTTCKEIGNRLSPLYVGKACGLGAPAHFSRLFKKMTGLTPLAYRQRKSQPDTTSN